MLAWGAGRLDGIAGLRDNGRLPEVMREAD